MTVDKIHRPSAGVNVIWKVQAFSSLPRARGQSFNSLLVFQALRAEQDWGTASPHPHIPESLHPHIPTCPCPSPTKGNPGGRSRGEKGRPHKAQGTCRGCQKMAMCFSSCPSQQNQTELHFSVRREQTKNKIEMAKLTSK